jgi:hypothetical protein
MDSNCNALSNPRSIHSGGMLSLYRISHDSTDESEAVSTTGSGCFLPIFTAKKDYI